MLWHVAAFASERRDDESNNGSLLSSMNTRAAPAARGLIAGTRNTNAFLDRARPG
ncbi:hypothetical protein ACVISU_003143 [Bradyrhizobium sp. USDA 4452]